MIWSMLLALLLLAAPAHAKDSAPYLEKAKALMARHGLKGVHPPSDIFQYLIHADQHRGHTFFTVGMVFGVTETGTMFGSIPLAIPNDDGQKVSVPITVEIDSPDVRASFRGVNVEPGHWPFSCVLTVKGFSKDIGLPLLRELECVK